MRICLLLFFTVILLSISQAQHFNSLRLGASAGFSKDNHYSIDATYGQRWAIGVRLEGYYKKDAASGFSFALQGNHYFKPLLNKLRPYMGIGSATYLAYLPKKSSLTISATGVTVLEYIDLPQQSPGGYIKAGLDYQHFSLVVEYNFIYRRVATVTYKDTGYYPLPQLTQQIFMSENYRSLKLGIYVGGGIKK